MNIPFSFKFWWMEVHLYLIFSKKTNKPTTSRPLETPLASHIQPHIYCVAARATSWEALKLFTASQDTKRREINPLRLGGGKSKLNKTYLTSFHAPLSQLCANNLPGALLGGWAASGPTGFAAQGIIIHKTQGKSWVTSSAFSQDLFPEDFMEHSSPGAWHTGDGPVLVGRQQPRDLLSVRSAGE